MASAGDCGAACAAAGARAGGAPSFARGAGTGNGTVCANTMGANPLTPTSTTPTSSLRRILGRMRTPLRFPDRVNRPMWRDDDCNPPGYPDCGEFSIVLRLFFADQDFTLAGVIGLPDDTLFLHSFHERGSAVIPDLQPTLDVAGRSLAIAHDDGHGLLIEVGALALTHSGRIENGLAVLILVLGRRHCLEVLRRSLRLEVPDDFFDLFIGAERPVDAADAAASGHVEHVALAEQLLGALLAQDCAAVDLGGDLE